VKATAQHQTHRLWVRQIHATKTKARERLLQMQGGAFSAAPAESWSRMVEARLSFFSSSRSDETDLPNHIFCIVFPPSLPPLRFGHSLYIFELWISLFGLLLL